MARTEPHSRQLACPRLAALQGQAVPIVPSGQWRAYLLADSPQLPYEDRPDEQRSPLHFGQLKLLTTMLSFLLWHTDASSGVEYSLIYAGAAPGNSAVYVAKHFPRITFYLFDPAEYAEELAAPPPNIRLFTDYFTDELAADVAARLAGRRILFVSDIRTGKTEDRVAADMAAQASWARILSAEASMMKFRLPWRPGQTEYLDGAVMLQAFAPLTSTETRLVSTRAQLLGSPRRYDHGQYERQMAWHNMLGRVHYHDHAVELPGLDHCWDCAALVRIGRELLLRETGAATDAGVAGWIATAVAALKTGRTLETVAAVSSTRRGKKRGSRKKSR